MDRMDDYQAIYHKTSDAPSQYPWRSILSDEGFGAIKTLKRLDHTNPSVDIDGMNDCQAFWFWPRKSTIHPNVHIQCDCRNSSIFKGTTGGVILLMSIRYHSNLASRLLWSFRLADLVLSFVLMFSNSGTVLKSESLSSTLAMRYSVIIGAGSAVSLKRLERTNPMRGAFLSSARNDA